MVLSEQQLYDYIRCPVYYDMKYNRRIPLVEPVSMQMLLNKAGKFFYVNLMNGKVPRLSELKHKWDSICEKNTFFVDAKRNLDGISQLTKLLRWAAAQKILVADVDSPYRILYKTADSFVELTGRIDAIVHLAQNYFEILVTDYSSRLPDQTLLDMKLKHTLDCFAFQTVYAPNALRGVRVHHVKTDRDFKLTRSATDFERLRTTVLRVAQSIHEKVFYPRESVLCSGCAAKDYCRVWS